MAVPGVVNVSVQAQHQGPESLCLSAWPPSACWLGHLAWFQTTQADSNVQEQKKKVSPQHSLLKSEEALPRAAPVVTSLTTAVPHAHPDPGRGKGSGAISTAEMDNALPSGVV